MWQRFFGTFWEQGKALAQRLTLGQKLTIAGLGAAVFIGLLALAFFTGRGSYVALARHGNAGELKAMADRLEEAGYAVRVNGGTLEVAEGQLPRALSYVASEVSSTPRRDGWAWLDVDPSWGETSVRQLEKIRRAKTINIEESIKICPDIVDVLVVLNVKDTPFTVIDSGDSENSASVTVTLAPGVGRLKPGQVRVIRSIVSGGASIPFRNVSVTDNRLNHYPVEEEELGGADGFDELRQSHIKDYRKRIAEYLEQTFRRCEYSLFVDVKLRRERIETSSEKIEPPKRPILTEEIVEKHTGRRDIGGRSPGTKANVSAGVYAPGESPAGEPAGDLATVDVENLDKTERRYEPLVSRTQDRRTSPAGAIEKISVAVRLDKQALENVVRKLRGIAIPSEGAAEDVKARQELEGAASDYIQENEKEITTMLQLHGPVDVSVRKDVLLATTDALAAAGAPSGGIWGWARENALLLTLAVLGVGALGSAYLLARRAIPPPIEIPALELPNEAEVALEAGAPEAPSPELPELRLEDKELSESIKQVEEVAREKPNLAASVVKMWVGSPGKADRKKP